MVQIDSHSIGAHVDPSTLLFNRFHSRRSTVYSNKGMIACSQPLAAAAGIEILNKGGNAADAAVAVSAVLGFIEPVNCGIGGDAFSLYYDGSTKKITGFNGSGRSPKALTLAKARELGITGDEIPESNINAATVPGCAAAWFDTIEKLGSGKITLREALDPAIRLAENGAPVSEITSLGWRQQYELLINASPNYKEMLVVDPETGDAHIPRPGEIFKNPYLAETYKKLASEGLKGFYEGRIAEAIVDVIKLKGGVMELSDLASHKTQFVEPISYSYGGEQGITLHEIPPNGHGLTALIALGILEALEDLGKIDFSKIDHNSPEWLHAEIEAIRLAFADTRAYVADQEHVKVPIEELLSKDYLKKRASLIDTKKAIKVEHGTPLSSSDTVLFVTSDAYGNACSYIQSNYAGFGTAAVPKGCGFTLQNRGANFILSEGHPNCLDGGKRPYHTIIPALVTKADGDLLMAYGVMGGFMQPQGHVQVLMNIVRGNLTPQEALDSPRFCIMEVPLSITHPEKANWTVSLEEGIPHETVEKLKAMGHSVLYKQGHSRIGFGKGQVIQKLSNGVWAAGSDQRGDGQAAPQI